MEYVQRKFPDSGDTLCDTGNKPACAVWLPVKPIAAATATTIQIRVMIYPFLGSRHGDVVSGDPEERRNAGDGAPV